MTERIEGERELLGEIYFERLERSRDCMDCLGSTVADQLLDKLDNQKSAILAAVEDRHATCKALSDLPDCECLEFLALIKEAE